MIFRSLPKKLKIKRKTYAVTYVPVLEKGKLAGIVDFETQEIKIATEGVARDEIESTIIHEMLHAIANEYDFVLTESMVVNLEQAIFKAFKKNRWRIVRG